MMSSIIIDFPFFVWYHNLRIILKLEGPVLSKYITKQRKLLLSFLENHVDSQLSTSQIANELKDDSISVSSVYRNLSDLELEGKVRRYVKAGNREAYYQYMASDKCKGCLHLSCKVCGRTFHMGTEGADLLVNTIAQTEGFSLDMSDTVLYGVCSACRRNSGQDD